jgi:DNA-binding IclR family transcriptional regulator
MVRSVRHAARLLRLLASDLQPLTLSDIARRVELSKPSTYHLLRTLEAERLVARDENGRYRLGWGVYEIGAAVTRSVDLTRVARPHLDRLSEETGEATLLGIADGTSVLYLDRGTSDESFQMIANNGRRSPLHSNASGKLLLAHMPEDFVSRMVADGLERRTAATITDPVELNKELARIRDRGFATCWQEQEVGLNSLAFPLRDYTRRVCAVLTIAGPAPRLTRRAVPRLVQLIAVHANSISTALGYAESTGAGEGLPHVD